MKLPEECRLYIRSMGKALRIVAICTDDASANRYMERNSSAAVVAEFPPYIFLADKHDRGERTGDMP